MSQLEQFVFLGHCLETGVERNVAPPLISTHQICHGDLRVVLRAPSLYRCCSALCQQPHRPGSALCIQQHSAKLGGYL